MPSPPRALVILAVSLAVTTTRLAAGDGGAPCAQQVGDFDVPRGTLEPGLACGTFFLATDAIAAVFSEGQALRREPARIPYEATVSVRRLTGDSGHSLGFDLVGAVLLLRDGYFGVYMGSEASFAWHELPGFRAGDEHLLWARQLEDRIELRIDGRPLATVPFRAASRASPVGVGLKSPPSMRGRLRFRDLRITPLSAGTAQGQAPAASPPRPK